MIRTAVVGVGYLGRFHAEKYSSSEKSELVAVVDVDESKAKACAEQHGCSFATDFRSLKDHGVRAVSIVTDTSRHYEVAAWCLENGIDVLVEKPMTKTVEEADALIRLAKKHQRVLQVGHLERFNPAFRAIKELLHDPRFFEVRRISPFSGRSQDIDVVSDLMIHDIDIISQLVDSPIASIDAIGVPVLTSTFDIANVRLTFANRAVANVTASRAAFASERTIRIFQPDLYISLDFEKKKFKVYRKTGPADGIGMPKISVDESEAEPRDALRDELESFIDCVVDRSVPEVTGEDGMRALKLAAEIRAAITQGLNFASNNSAEKASADSLLAE